MRNIILDFVNKIIQAYGDEEPKEYSGWDFYSCHALRREVEKAVGVITSEAYVYSFCLEDWGELFKEFLQDLIDPEYYDSFLEDYGTPSEVGLGQGAWLSYSLEHTNFEHDAELRHAFFYWIQETYS